MDCGVSGYDAITIGAPPLPAAVSTPTQLTYLVANKQEVHPPPRAECAPPHGEPVGAFKQDFRHELKH